MKRKKQKEVVAAKRKAITVVNKRDVKDPKLSYDPYTFDAAHHIFTIDKTYDAIHLTSAANKTDDVVHQTSAGVTTFHANHVAYGLNNEDQKNFESRQIIMILNSLHIGVQTMRRVVRREV